MIKGEVFVESKGAQAFQQTLKQFQGAVERDKQALMIGVYRAKLSEGLSLNDSYVRAVICVGIPYPNLGDSFVQKKRQFNTQLVRQQATPQLLLGPTDHAQSSGKPLSEEKEEKVVQPAAWLTGERWYEVEAFRALNQALGRVIRHPLDFGAIILIDSRHVGEVAIRRPTRGPKPVVPNDISRRLDLLRGGGGRESQTSSGIVKPPKKGNLVTWVKPFLSVASSLSDATRTLHYFFHDAPHYVAAKVRGHHPWDNLSQDIEDIA